MSTSPPPDRHPLGPAVARYCADVTEALGEEVPEATRTAIRAATGRLVGDHTSVIVVGEQKRGKSSLINALLGADGLMPEDVDVATTVHVAVRHAPKLSALAWFRDATEPQPIKLSELSAYAAVDPESRRPRHPDVVAVTVDHPADLLTGGLELIDTPGVGGLDSGHARLTMTALDRADLLVFVTSGASEMTASELRFLTEATERIAIVLFVLAQIDKYPNWSRTLERNRELLAGHAPRFVTAPWFPVSSVRWWDGVEAEERGEHDTARERRHDSGLPDLVAALADAAARGSQVRLGNALHVARNEVDGVVARSSRLLRRLSRDPGVEAEVADLTRQLAALESSGAAWRTTVRTRTRELGERLQLGFQRSLSDLRTLLDKRIAEAEPLELKEIPAEVEAGVRALWADLETETGKSVRGVLDEITQGLGTPGLETTGTDLVLPERLRRLPAMVVGRQDNRSAIDHLERLSGSYRTGALTATLLAVVTGGVAIPLMVGVLITGEAMFNRLRRDQTTRSVTDVTRHVARVVSDLGVEGPVEIRRVVDLVDRSLVAHVTTQLTTERAQLRAELTEQEQLVAADDRRVERRRAELQDRVDRLTALSGRGAELQVRLEGDLGGAP
ncbi:dynamin family protein [Micromonospora sp. SH-82]|uniref:dynamin family protein n=1 Tax=Micromonospora sp. SH-82 TaxID=3132938 RepID=UPI003EBED7D2